MQVTQAVVAWEHEPVHDRSEQSVEILNGVRADLGALFGTEVGSVTVEQYRGEVDTVFADGNVAALVALLREVDVADDYPGFVVDELLGRELAGMLAGG